MDKLSIGNNPPPPKYILYTSMYRDNHSSYTSPFERPLTGLTPSSFFEFITIRLDHLKLYQDQILIKMQHIY